MRRRGSYWLPTVGLARSETRQAEAPGSLKVAPLARVVLTPFELPVRPARSAPPPTRLGDAMCGICGVIDPGDRRAAPVPGPVLDRMTDAMTHRGPNDRGTFS